MAIMLGSCRRVDFRLVAEMAYAARLAVDDRVCVTYSARLGYPRRMLATALGTTL